jgi:hypothetical protein
MTTPGISNPGPHSTPDRDEAYPARNYNESPKPRKKAGLSSGL